jgi:mRNA-degrading endonuclease RelE of RelBE toxin-antitoxin system
MGWEVRLSNRARRDLRKLDRQVATRVLKRVSEMLGHASTATTARFYVRDSLTDDELFNGEGL